MNKLVLALALLAAPLFAQTVSINGVPNQTLVGPSGTPQYIAPQAIAGCGVEYVSGLTYTVGACNYSINGVTYNSPLSNITLPAADATNPEIDVIFVDTTGVVQVIQGTPAVTPQQPVVDPSTQLQLTFVLVPATATTPANTTSVLIYDEGTEWTAAKGGTSSANVNLTSTNNPYHGTHDTEFGAGGTVATTTYAQYTKPAAGTVTLGNYNTLTLYVRNKAAWPKTRSVTVQWYNGTTPLGTAVVLSNGAYGFDATGNITSYQQISIPASTFGINGTAATTVRFTVSGSGSNLTGFYLDEVSLQGGNGGVLLPTTVMNYRGAWSSTATYAPNDTVVSGGLGYVAIAANTNQAVTNTAYWTPLATNSGGSGSSYVAYLSSSCTGTPIDPTIGLTAAGGAGTDYATCINGLITTAAGAPLKIVVDESVKTSNIHIPVAGNVDIEGLGAGIANTPITNCSLTSNVATLTAKNNFKAGQNVLFSGLSTCSFMNIAHGESAPYFTVSATGLSSTSFQVAVTHANTSGAEAGYATFLYGTWLFAAAGANNDLINVAPSGTIPPTSPNAAPKGRGANVIVRNLGLNGNRGNGTDGNSNSGDPKGATWISDIHIWDMDNVLIDGVDFYNSPSFALTVDNTGNIKVINSRVDAFLPGETVGETNQDGFHFNGYVNDAYLSNDYLRTGDDPVALNAPEGYCGPITRFVANNITLDRTFTGGRAYTNSTACTSGVNPIINYVAFDGWVGNTIGYAFDFGFISAGSLTNSIDNFTWTNSRITAANGFRSEDSIGNLTFDNVKLLSISGGTAWFFPSTTAVISNLTMNNDAAVRTSAGNNVAGGISTGIAAAITNLSIDGFRIEDQGASFGAVATLLNAASGTITNLSYSYDTKNITALNSGFTITNINKLDVSGAVSSVFGRIGAVVGAAGDYNWSQIGTGTATTLATFPGGDLFNGGVNAQTGTSYTILTSDENKTVTFSNASAIAVTLPAASTTGFGSGAMFSFLNLGAGAVTITPTTSTINGGSSLVLASGSSADIVSNGTNYNSKQGSGAGGITGTSPIVVSGGNVSCPTCSVGSGTNVTINGGSSLGTANFNGTTPAAPTGTTNVAMQVSGSNVSGYVPILPSQLPKPAALGSWTWMNQGTATVSNNGGMLAMTVVDGSSLNWRILKQSTASTPYSYAFFFKTIQFAANSQTTGIYLTDGTKLLGLEVVTQGGGPRTLRVEHITNVTTDGSTPQSTSLVSGIFLSDVGNGGLYGRFRNDGTNIYVDLSVDGANWTNWYSETIGTFITPNAVGFGGLSVTSGAAPYVVNSLQGFLYTASGSL